MLFERPNHGLRRTTLRLGMVVCVVLAVVWLYRVDNASRLPGHGRLPGWMPEFEYTFDRGGGYRAALRAGRRLEFEDAPGVPGLLWCDDLYGRTKQEIRKNIGEPDRTFTRRRYGEGLWSRLVNGNSVQLKLICMQDSWGARYSCGLHRDGDLPHCRRFLTESGLVEGELSRDSVAPLVRPGFWSRATSDERDAALAAVAYMALEGHWTEAELEAWDGPEPTRSVTWRFVFDDEDSPPEELIYPIFVDLDFEDGDKVLAIDREFGED